MVNTEKIAGLIREQIELENSTLKELEEAEAQAAETAVRLVYLDMKLDTWKHVKFLEGVLEALDVTPCDQWSAKVQRYVDRVKMERKVKSIIQKEREMYRLSSEAANLMTDPMGKFLLDHLREDEERHTKDLEDLIRIVQTLPLQSKKGQKGTDIVCEE